MLRTALLFAAVTAVLALAACGGPAASAVVGATGVRVLPKGGEWAEATGPVAFGNGDAIEASGPAVVRVAVGGTVTASEGVDGDPGAGRADLHLDAGTTVRRRQETALDLVSGSMRMRAGPVAARIVVFHGTTFLEIPTSNPAGIDVEMQGADGTVTVEVTSGKVQLNATGATQKELHFVVLGPGESAVAKPGEKPQKR